VSAISNSPSDAHDIVAAVIDEYLARAVNEIQINAEVSEQYYSQQLAVAQQAVLDKNAELQEYLGSHPKAVDPTNPASREVAYLTLQGQLQSRAAIVTSLQASLQSVQLRAASAPQTQQAQFAVQDMPNEPTAPLPVSLTTRVGTPMAGMLLGLLIGAAYVYVAYRTDHTIRSGEDLGALKVPILGAVPQLQPAPGILRYTPIGWFIAWQRRDFARRTAASIVQRAEPKPTEASA
jgi:capsular polysaccharide biosynthesis protein